MRPLGSGSRLLSLLALLATAASAQPVAHVAYAWADNPTAASYSPGAAFAFNPAGGVTAERSGVGTYAVVFDGFGAFASDEGGAAGHVQVTAYGSSATCSPSSWSGSVVRVRCHGPSGAPVDARFTVLWIVPGGNAGQVGFAWADDAGATAPYLPAGRYAYNSAGRSAASATGDVRVERSQTGRYDVDFALAGRLFSFDAGGNGAAFASAYGTAPGDCQVSDLRIASADADAEVRCTDASGAAADSRFTVLALWPGANLGTLAYTHVRDASSPTSTPGPYDSLNPGGGATTVTRSGVGSYLVTFAGLRAVAPEGTSGTAQVTPTGTAAARCAVQSWGGSSDVGVVVQCRTPGGALADSPFQVMLLYGETPAPAPPATFAFEDQTPGTVLVNEFYEQGVRFPNGLEVIDCTARAAACTNAASSDRAAAPAVSFEFDRAPFVAEFVTPQDSVSLVVNGFGQDGREYSVLLQAFDASGAVVREDYAVFESGPGWPVRLAVRTNTREIVRAELFVTRDGVVRNDVLVDDLAVSHPVPPGADATPPKVTVTAPAATSSNPVSFRVRASDDVALDRVTALVVFEPTGEQVFPAGGASGDLCGGTAAPCPTTDFESNPSFYTVGDGRYLVRATAVDAGGNVVSRQATTTYTTPTVPVVSAVAVEANQGASEGMYEAYTTISNGVPLIQGKPLLLRYYLFHQGAEGTVVEDYAARVEARFEYADGSVREETVFSNVGPATVDVRRDPGPDGRAEPLFAMRADPTRTLNFVVPGTWTAAPDLVLVQFRLYDSARATNIALMQTRTLRRSVLGLNVYRISNADLNGDAGTPTTAELNTRILPLMRNALPVSEVRVLRDRPLRYSGARAPRGALRCRRLLRAFWWNVDGSRAGMPDDAPGWVTNLALARNVGDDCSGIAWRGDATDGGDRSFDSFATSELFGDVAAHEVMHTIGFKHASDAHGEGDGGSFEPWPFPHGLLSSGGIGFGVALRPDEPATDRDPGTWFATLIDPCPGLTFGGPACTLTDVAGVAHELMSYGNGLGGTVPYTTLFDNWLSERNSHRVDLAIRLAIQPSARRAGDGALAAAEDLVPTFLVSADIDPDGGGEFGPFLAKPVRTSLVQGQPAGPLSLDLYDAAGALLSRTPLEATEIADGEDADWTFVRAYVPFVAGVRRAVLTRDGTAVLEETASAAAPTVRVLAPNGGEQIPTGPTTVRWEMADADGDALTALVQYSPDGGATWEGLAVLAEGETEVTVEVDELTAGTDGVLRVAVSDGLNVADDRSDGPFAFGTAASGTPTPQPLPADLAVVSAAPNPFSGRTRVTFALPAPASVTVEVFDTLGRRVAVLAEGDLAAGEHDAVFDATGLPSGLYLVRVAAAGHVATVSVLLAQ